MNKSTTFNLIDERTRADVRQLLLNMPLDGSVSVEFKKVTKQRTLTQNASLHKWCALLSEAFNLAGFDQRNIKDFKSDLEIPWTPEAIKHFFRLVAKEMYRIDRTTKLNTKQIQEVYEVTDREFSKHSGITIAWPSIESMREDSHVRAA